MEAAMNMKSAGEAACDGGQGPQPVNPQSTSTLQEGFDLKSWVQMNFPAAQSAPLKEHREEGQEKNTDTNQDPSEARPSNTGLDFYMPEQALLTIPERELNRIMGEKDNKISALEEEQRVIVKDIDQVKKKIAEEEEEKAFIDDALFKSMKIRMEAEQKIRELEEILQAEVQRRQKAETHLARETEETSKVQLKLAQAENNLELSRRQCEEDRSRLLAEQKQENSDLEAAVIQAQEDLVQKRLQWQKEKSSLEESLKTINQALKEKEEKMDEVMNEVTDELMCVEKQMEAQRKPKRKSLWKRFRQLFKRT